MTMLVCFLAKLLMQIVAEDTNRLVERYYSVGQLAHWHAEETADAKRGKIDLNAARYAK